MPTSTCGPRGSNRAPSPSPVPASRPTGVVAGQNGGAARSTATEGAGDRGEFRATAASARGRAAPRRAGDHEALRPPDGAARRIAADRRGRGGRAGGGERGGQVVTRRLPGSHPRARG